MGTTTMGIGMRSGVKMPKAPSTSLRARWLGEWLREARTSANYKLSDVGEYLQMDHTTLGRFERGTHRIRRSYVKDLIDFYGISDEQTRHALLKLNEDSWRRDWWQGETGDLEESFIDYTWLEARSSKIRIFEPMFLPGLLQTRDYVNEVMSHGRGPEAEPAQRQRLVDLRMARQQILSGKDATPLSTILEEAPLRRPVGDSRVHVEQLQSLVDLSKQSHIDIRILPTSAGWHIGVAGGFRYFDMPDPYPDVAAVESLVGRTFFEEQSKVARYREAYDELQRSALTPKRSVELIRIVMKELE